MGSLEFEFFEYRKQNNYYYDFCLLDPSENKKEKMKKRGNL